MEYTSYLLATGEIKVSFGTSDANAVPLNTPENCSTIIGRYNSDKYRVEIDVTPHAAVEKSEIEYTLDGAQLSNLPTGTRVSVGDDVVTVDDGVLTIEADLPGTYRVRLWHPLHLDTFVDVVI